jgi:regulatory protein YycH of two-component signal transduction system YycFG
MTDRNYTTTFTVNEDPNAVFAAINNVRGWWSEDIEGYTTNAGDVWYYSAPDLHRCTLKVIDSVPGNKIAWRVLDNSFTFIEDKAEWIGTTMLFDIERIGTQTKVKFTHDGLVPDYECYDVCHDAWGTYINGSLKDLITSGKGQPNAGSAVTAKEPERSYTTAFTVTQSPQAVFTAIVNPRAWWSGEHDGMADRVGDTFTYRYKQLHYSKQQVTELVPGKRVAWYVTEAMLAFVEDKTEWAGTTITFDIAKKGDRTEVVFTHLGLKPAVECFDTCSDAWTSLIQGSLKQLIETGKTELLELDAPAA